MKKSTLKSAVIFTATTILGGYSVEAANLFSTNDLGYGSELRTNILAKNTMSSDAGSFVYAELKCGEGKCGEGKCGEGKCGNKDVKKNGKDSKCCKSSKKKQCCDKNKKGNKNCNKKCKKECCSKSKSEK